MITPIKCFFFKCNLFFVGPKKHKKNKNKNKNKFFILLIAAKNCITRCGCGELYSAETDEVCAVLYLKGLMFILDENK